LVAQQPMCWFGTSFMPQWIMREYLARRGSNAFKPDTLEASRCPLLGYSLKGLQVEGTVIPQWFLRTHTQPEVGEAGYDAGAEQLYAFFRSELDQFLRDDDLHPYGREIIEACLDNATAGQYEGLLDGSPFAAGVA
ncbi:MAG: DUF4914 family protein, partial [Planctomycetota bacterium]